MKEYLVSSLEKNIFIWSLVKYDIAQDSRSFKEGIYMFLFSF